MLILNANEIRQSLPMAEAIPAMKQALATLARGNASIPLRTHIDIEGHHGTTLVMPGHVFDPDGESLAVKVVSIFNQNAKQGLPNILGVVNVFDPKTGAPVALLDGSAVTGIRTAATSAAATDLLARKDASRLAIIGSGAQAFTHFHAMLAVRDIRQVRIYSPNRSNVEGLIHRLASDRQVMAANSSAEATGDADIVCTVTNSQAPVIDDDAIPCGCHINAIGSYKPDVVEIPAGVVSRSRLYVDHRETALSEAGDLIQPLRRGEINADHLIGELGQLVTGQIVGRTSDIDITLFKSVGNTVEDVVAAQLIFDNARRLGLGQNVDF